MDPRPNLSETELGPATGWARMAPGGAIPRVARSAALELPADYYPPAGAVHFIVQGTDLTVAAPSGWVELDAVTLDSARRGVVRDVELNVGGALTATDNLRWRIVVNAGPVEGWTVELFPRVAAAVTVSFLPQSVFIRLPAGARVSLEYNLAAAGAPLNVGGRLRGWSYSDGV